jgi:hypothetical protein
MLHRITKSGRTAAIAAAVAVAVAGAGSATAASLVTGASVKNGTLTGTDVKNGSLKRADLSHGVRDALDAKGIPGPAGPAGPAGANGANGANGATAVRVAKDSSQNIDAPGEKILELTLPAGAHLIQAKTVLDSASTATEGRCELDAGPTLLDYSLASLVGDRGNTVALSAAVQLGVETKVQLRCESDNVAMDPIVARRAVMTATEVQQLLGS